MMGEFNVRGRELLKVAEVTGECIISGSSFGGRLRLGFQSLGP